MQSSLRRSLKDRLEGFGLEVATEKTHRIEFGAYAVENAKRKGEKRPVFTFLGFTHYCGHTRHGHFKVKRCTSIKKFRAKLHGVYRVDCKGTVATLNRRSDAQSEK